MKSVGERGSLSGGSGTAPGRFEGRLLLLLGEPGLGPGEPWKRREFLTDGGSKKATDETGN